MSDPGVSAFAAEPPTLAAAAGSGEDALLGAVHAVQATLRGLLENEPLLGQAVLADVRATLEAVEARAARERLQVVIVGERGSGKSTLLDAIVGDRLLGGARGQSAVVTYLRRRPAPSFRARFASGALDDFAIGAPDRAQELEQEAEALKLALVEGEERRRSLRTEWRQAIVARERADLHEQRARSGLQGARELEGVASSELSDLEQEAARLDGEVGAIEPSVPALVRRPAPRWAFWLWLVQAAFALLRRSVWQRYRALQQERDALQQRLLARRSSAHEAAQARALAEAGLEPLDSGANRAREHSGEVERSLREAETERERLRGELESLRSRREHHESERWRQFYSELQALSRRSDLVELSIDYPAKLLPDDVTIIDVPGLASDTDPLWQLIREQADGCILVSELDRAVSESAKQFLRQLREVVPHLLLVLTKMDQAFQKAERRGAEQPWDEVELARRIGTRRFARELGRNPDSVLSLAVAAEAALSAPGSELATRFDTEVEKLFLLLRRERALIVGARAADALRRCIAGFAEAESDVERSYRQRIATLERQRTPEPEVFKQHLLGEVGPAVEVAAANAVDRASAVLEDGCLLLQRKCEQEVDACSSAAALVEVATKLSHDLAERLAEVQQQAYLELESGVDREVAKLEHGLFEAVRTRYQLLHEIRRSTGSSPRLGLANDEQPQLEQLGPEVLALVVGFRRGRMALGASGSLAGMASGALVHPWLGAALGAALGGLLALARREGSLRDQVRGALTAAVTKQKAAYLTRLGAETPVVSEAVRATLERSLERALIHFARWINEPLEAERQAIESERQKLVQLEGLRDQVNARDHELETSLKAATQVSVGLCR